MKQNNKSLSEILPKIILIIVGFLAVVGFAILPFFVKSGNVIEVKAETPVYTNTVRCYYNNNNSFIDADIYGEVYITLNNNTVSLINYYDNSITYNIINYFDVENKNVDAVKWKTEGARDYHILYAGQKVKLQRSYFDTYYNFNVYPMYSYNDFLPAEKYNILENSVNSYNVRNGNIYLNTITDAWFVVYNIAEDGDVVEFYFYTDGIYYAIDRGGEFSNIYKLTVNDNNDFNNFIYQTEVSLTTKPNSINIPINAPLQEFNYEDFFSYKGQRLNGTCSPFPSKIKIDNNVSFIDNYSVPYIRIPCFDFVDDNHNLVLDLYNFNLNQYSGADNFYIAGYLNYNNETYDIGYNNGYNLGKDAGYKQGFADGNAEKWTNPIAIFFEPVFALLNKPLIGDISLADIATVGVSVCVAVIFIKMFAGG